MVANERESEVLRAFTALKVSSRGRLELGGIKGDLKWNGPSKFFYCGSRSFALNCSDHAVGYVFVFQYRPGSVYLFFLDSLKLLGLPATEENAISMLR